MAIGIDHVAIPVRDPEAASRFLGDLLGLEALPDGPDSEFRSLRLDGGVALLFACGDPPVYPHHVALRVDPKEFDEILLRLHSRKIPFGNDPEDRMNERWEDPLGGRGRVYFLDLDGHLFEVCA
jgi:catechol 2,3-dioxygenase-like lactoylglutathione lyase family enzyme